MTYNYVVMWLLAYTTLVCTVHTFINNSCYVKYVPIQSDMVSTVGLEALCFSVTMSHEVKLYPICSLNSIQHMQVEYS